jgi:MOSC domain-containing protein YiiM
MSRAMDEAAVTCPRVFLMGETVVQRQAACRPCGAARSPH